MVSEIEYVQLPITRESEAVSPDAESSATDSDGRIRDQEPFISGSHFGRVTRCVHHPDDHVSLVAKARGSRVAHLGLRALTFKVETCRDDALEFRAGENNGCVLR